MILEEFLKYPWWITDVTFGCACQRYLLIHSGIEGAHQFSVREHPILDVDSIYHLGLGVDVHEASKSLGTTAYTVCQSVSQSSFPV